MPYTLTDSDVQTLFRDILPRLARIERWIRVLAGNEAKMETSLMADKASIDRMTADVAANTVASQAAATALNGYLTSVTDLTKQLQDAIAEDDTEAVKAAADALEANNAALAAATPVVAAAVAVGTPAATPADVAAVQAAGVSV